MASQPAGLTAKQIKKTTANVRKVALKTGAANKHTKAPPDRKLEKPEEVVLRDLPLTGGPKPAKKKPVTQKGSVRRSRSIQRTTTSKKSQVSKAKAKAKRAASSGAGLRKKNTTSSARPAHFETDTRSSAGDKSLDEHINARLRAAHGMVVVRDESAGAEKPLPPQYVSGSKVEQEEKDPEEAIQELRQKLQQTHAKVRQRGYSLKSMHRADHPGGSHKDPRRHAVEVAVVQQSTDGDGGDDEADMVVVENDSSAGAGTGGDDEQASIRYRGRSMIEAAALPANAVEDDGMGSDSDDNGDPYAIT